ncbi:MAG: class I SAM-dependent methyltransferase [Thermodesulfovibrionales bacterium]|nr:class I SAM-dependent methyltransferase [Thermodesulfovibrionales bacterium]
MNLKRMHLKILDVGCGNHSPSQTKKYFPLCEYHGIDKQEYNLTELDYAAMDRFFKIDLNKDNLDELPNGYYDYIICSHVLEHVIDPYSVISQCCKKLRGGGMIYLEFPSVKSFSLPSMKGTLHFCDDDTHIRLVDLTQVINLLLDLNFKIIYAGKRRNWLRIILLPLLIVYSIVVHKHIGAGVFWDLLGFADKVVAIKKESWSEHEGAGC